jgi:hypothetical protein
MCPSGVVSCRPCRCRCCLGNRVGCAPRMDDTRPRRIDALVLGRLDSRVGSAHRTGDTPRRCKWSSRSSMMRSCALGSGSTSCSPSLPRRRARMNIRELEDRESARLRSLRRRVSRMFSIWSGMPAIHRERTLVEHRRAMPRVPRVERSGVSMAVHLPCRPLETSQPSQASRDLDDLDV